ncbi:unnamed protein product [Linum trigynum]|uniref:Uncharacterized protein n=1 Tax=Linum trigynum TaxID=586398 RepID=A0AAV2GWC3_9ROSI
MEFDRRAETRSTSSVLHGDETFYNRVISRDSSTSSVRCPSGRVFYYRSAAEGVPFNWETQPGTPKNNPPKEESIPPITPPPAVLSLSLPKPSINHQAGAGYHNARKLKLLWKFLVGTRRRRWYGHRHTQARSLENVNDSNNNSNMNTRRRSWDEAGDIIASSCNSSFSSSTMSRSSSHDDRSPMSSNSDASSGSTRSRRETGNSRNDYGRGCGSGRPWNINSLLVCVSGKI